MGKGGFIYVNSNLRIGKEPEHHYKERTITWVDSTRDIWSQGSWDSFKAYINANCHGSTRGAQVIEKVLNTLGKYAGNEYAATNIPLTNNEMQSLGITDVIASDLVKNLAKTDLGTSGVAMSLLDYFVTGKGVQTAQNAGFSFESRLSEFIQRLSGTKNFQTYIDSKGKTQSTAKALRSGTKQLSVGQTLRDISLEDINYLYNYVVDETGKKVRQEVDIKTNSDGIFKFGYAVTGKADITVPTTLNVTGEYGPVIEDFLRTIRGKKLSLKNTSESQITIDSTKDPTRLMGFADLFLQGKGYNIAGLASFVFASRNSKKEDVQRFADWGRIFYGLMGAGQYSRGQEKNDYQLVDYLIINSYTPRKTQSGQVRVFSMKDLIPSAAPNVSYDPPFKIYNNTEFGYHGGEIQLNLPALMPQSFKFISAT